MPQVRLVVTFLILSTVILSCTSSEDRARDLHNQSLEAERSGNLLQHEELLQRIVSDYPSTGTAAAAKKELEDIRFNREVLVAKTVDLMRTIVAGQVLFLTERGRYAQSLEELAESKRG